MTADASPGGSSHVASLLDEAINLRAAGETQRAADRARHAQAALPPDASDELRGRVALTLGNALADLGEYEAADDALHDAGRYFVSEARWTEYAQAQISRGRVQAERGNTAEALEFFSQLEKMDLPAPLRSQVLNNLGLLNRLSGNLGEAIAYLAEDARLCSENGDAYGAGVANYNLAGALAAAGQNTQSREHAEKAARWFRACRRDDLAAEAHSYGLQQRR